MYSNRLKMGLMLFYDLVMCFKRIEKINRSVRRIVSVLFATVLLVTTGNLGFSVKQAQADENVKGVWLSFLDHQSYLSGKSQDDYDSTFESICQTAEDYGLNTIFVHVRSHNDAIYPSKIYPWSSEMLSGTDPGFDPLADMVDIAHQNGLEIHAWINPYGYRNGEYCGDAFLATNDNIVAGVAEILDNYDVDGIHFDDYFPPIGAKKINSMVSRVHSECSKHGIVFGISPQGNIDNCIEAGVDVKTWLSSAEYVDYIAPQIYWTDNYGSSGTTTMSSDRLAAWEELNTAEIPMYVGMALYRAGESSKSDPGWSMKTDNLASQWKKAKSLGYTGYILFNTESIMSPNSAQKKELTNVK